MLTKVAEDILADIHGLNAEFEEMDDALVTLLRFAEALPGTEDRRIVRFLVTHIREHAMELHGQAVQSLEDIGRADIAEGGSAFIRENRK